MTGYPSTWIGEALNAAAIDPSADAIAIMKAWKNSTPLPSYVNNPIGMPAGTLGSPALLSTSYGMFPTMKVFYAAFASFAQSYQGGELARAMASDNPYAQSWRVISSLNWPGSQTETDYPSVLLDMTADSYRKSVRASSPDNRKTSGVVGQDAPNKSSVIENARNLANAGNAVSGASDMVRYLMRSANQGG